MLEQSAFDERVNLMRDKLGFGLRIFRGDNSREGTGRIVCYQASGRVEKITQRVGQFDQVSRRAVIVCQPDHFRAGMQEWIVEQETRIRSEPGENSLRWVACDGEVPVFSRQQLEQFELNVAEVLRLVGEDPAKSRLEDAPNLGVCLK